MDAVALIDLDGVIADSSTREKRALAVDPTRGELFWEEFLDPFKLRLDTPIVGTKEAVERIKRHGYKVSFLSSRPEGTWVASFEWLIKYGFVAPYKVSLFLKPPAFKFCKTKFWKAAFVAGSCSRSTSTIFIDDDEGTRAMFSDSGCSGISVYSSVADAARALDLISR